MEKRLEGNPLTVRAIDLVIADINGDRSESDEWLEMLRELRASLVAEHEEAG